MIKWYYHSLIVLVLLFHVETHKEKCDKCVLASSCSFFGNLKREEQERWVERFECPKNSKEAVGPLSGFSSSAKGDMVCCSDFIWGTNENDDGQEARGQSNIDYNAQYNAQPDYKQPYQGDSTFNNRPIDSGYSNLPNNNFNGNGYDSVTNSPSDSNYDPNYETHRSSHHHRARQPYNQGSWASGSAGNNWNRNPQNYGGNSNSFGVNDNSFARSGNSFGGNGNGIGGNRNTFGGNGNSFSGNGNTFRGNGFGGSNFGNQCPVTSFPPNPETGCCGREAADSDRITVRQPWAPWNEERRAERPWKSPMDEFLQKRYKREDAVNVTVDNRIAGGKETDLEQFPWTVLLKTTFDYGTSESAFNCGGSLISSYYVLTAGHCVVDQGARVKDIEIYLAEYDKRTFPRDCKNVLGEGRKCVENIITRAEKVIPHPNYDNDRLFNDIALLRLRQPAPYTDYIRPICLPPINVDEPDFFNLRLAVAGWGRNGKYKSDIKQSTVVNLVPTRECSRYYPNLSKSHLCAAGYSGEDTCKGDSGGPLMLQYEGKYFVSGVVSGKRADAPCGTSVPSLYTNVYQHLDWIRRNIRN